MKKPIVAFTFVFFFLFLSIPSYAYLPVLANVSSSIPSSVSNVKGMMCPNATYCYVLGQGSGTNTRIYRYNATLGAETYCSIDNDYTIYGTAMVNTSQLRVTYASYSIDYNVDALAGGTCANTTGHISLDFTGYEIGAWYDAVTDWYYYPGRIVNYTGSVMMPNYNRVSLNGGFILSNKTDNATTYDYYRLYGTINKYASGVYSSTIADPHTIWGINDGNESNDYYSMDLVKANASTTLGYIMDKEATPFGVRLYLVNFTRAENLGLGTNITASSPINNLSISAVMSETVQLTADLTTYNNGTISWYNDGVFLGNTSITANYSSSVAYSTPVLADGQHYWNATFYDIYGNSWNTGNQTYFKEATSAITTVGQSLANALGVSLDYGKMMLALLISIALSGALAYWVKWQLFLPGMIVCVFFFAVAGFFPVWITMIFMVIGGILFAKFSGLV